MRHNYTIDVQISILGKRLWQVYSFALVPAGIRTTYRPVHSLIHVYVLYNFILLYYRREIRRISVEQRWQLQFVRVYTWNPSFFYYMNMFQCRNVYNC